MAAHGRLMTYLPERSHEEDSIACEQGFLDFFPHPEANERFGTPFYLTLLGRQSRD